MDHFPADDQGYCCPLTFSSNIYKQPLVNSILSALELVPQFTTYPSNQGIPKSSLL